MWFTVLGLDVEHGQAQRLGTQVADFIAVERQASQLAVAVFVLSD